MLVKQTDVTGIGRLQKGHRAGLEFMGNIQVRFTLWHHRMPSYVARGVRGVLAR